MSNDAQPAPAEGRPKPIFDQVRFQHVLSERYNAEDAEKITQYLKDNGAEEVAKPTFDGLALSEATHFISKTSDFPQYHVAKEMLLSVVKPDWVTASIAKNKTANPRQHSPDPKMFFSGLVVCCADLPPGDSDAIIGGVLAVGGLHTGAVTKMVTHIVALTLDPDKCKVAIAKNLKVKIVLPHWFDDCLRLGKRIEEAPYCLPDPEILRRKPEDRIPDAARPDMHGSSATIPSSLSPPERKLTVFKNKVVMLSPDLGIGSHLRGTIEGLIKGSGGDITGSVYKSDIFICQFRETRDYRIASRAKQDVGNLAWLYHLFTHDAWTSPTRRLLHYPIAREGLPGFNQFRISLSNYNGEARVYLENLAKAAGGEFTKTMKEENTHLITAHLHSEKCEAAVEWNIHIVNHLWLEESYAKWQIQSVANPRYTHFPQRTNLGEIVGKTEIDRQAIEKKFFPEDADDDSGRVVAGVRSLNVRDPNANFKVPVPNGTAAHPTSSGRAPEPIPIQSDDPTPKASKASKKPSEATPLRTPAPQRCMNNEKENDTPSTTGSRGAKEKAAAKLHDMAPDIQLFEKEMKRIGGVLHGGRKSSEDIVSDNGRKRSMSKDDEQSTEADESGRPAKKAKKTRDTPVMQLLLSGYRPWVGNFNKESKERAQLRDLGIQTVTNGVKCTHVAVPRITRTPKFVSCLAHAPMILTLDYVDQCLAQKTRLDPKDFLLQESEEDKARGYSIAESNARAKANKRRLLRGNTIYCTPGLNGGWEAYKQIIAENGGQCQLYKARGSSAAAVHANEMNGEDDDTPSSTPEYLYLLSSDSSEDAKLWSRFRQMAQSKGRIPRIVANNWILDVVIRQEMFWSDQHEMPGSAA